MVSCTFPCAVSNRINLEIRNFTVSPTVAQVNQNVTVGFDVVDKSLLYGGNVAIDVYDLDGFCGYSEPVFWLGKGETRAISFTFPMPNKNVKLRISAASQVVPPPPLIAYWRCEDFKLANVTLYDPTSTNWSCSEIAGCVRGPGNYISESECARYCITGGGFGTCTPACPSSDMCVLGICLPKPVVFIGLAGLVYMMISGGK